MKCPKVRGRNSKHFCFFTKKQFLNVFIVKLCLVMICFCLPFLAKAYGFHKNETITYEIIGYVSFTPGAVIFAHKLFKIYLKSRVQNDRRINHYNIMKSKKEQLINQVKA